MNKLGALGEKLAERFLFGKGYVVVARNWHCREGEIDLIFRDGLELVFVEVKLRTGSGFGAPEEAIDYYKRRKFLKAVFKYLESRPAARFRIDAVLIVLAGKRATVEHIKNIDL